MSPLRAPVPVSLGVAILAAGASRRMGQPKLLLPWSGTSVLGHLLSRWQAASTLQITVACAPDDRALAGELDRLGFPVTQRILNPTPEAGMFSSIRCAAAWPGWQPGLTHVAIALGDQPQIRLETLQALLRFVEAHPAHICQPRQAGHRGHPVVLPWERFRELHRAPEETFRRYLERRAELRADCEVRDGGLALDLDTPADYERALRWVRENG